MKNPPKDTPCEAIGKEYCMTHDRDDSECHVDVCPYCQQDKAGTAVHRCTGTASADCTMKTSPTSDEVAEAIINGQSYLNDYDTQTYDYPSYIPTLLARSLRTLIAAAQTAETLKEEHKIQKQIDAAWMRDARNQYVDLTVKNTALRAAAAASLIAETKALREHCDYLEGELRAALQSSGGCEGVTHETLRMLGGNRTGTQLADYLNHAYPKGFRIIPSPPEKES